MREGGLKGLSGVFEVYRGLRDSFSWGTLYYRGVAQISRSNFLEPLDDLHGARDGRY